MRALSWLLPAKEEPEEDDNDVSAGNDRAPHNSEVDWSNKMIKSREATVDKIGFIIVAVEFFWIISFDQAVQHGWSEVKCLPAEKHPL
jgi:hypothetical protein